MYRHYISDQIKYAAILFKHIYTVLDDFDRVVSVKVVNEAVCQLLLPLLRSVSFVGQEAVAIHTLHNNYIGYGFCV